MAGTRKFDEGTVLEQAINLFWSKGYNATTMLDLANETGVQRGSLYNAYQNKNTLFLKAFEHHIKLFLQRAEAELESQDALQAFHNLFSSMIKRLCTDKDRRGCFSTRVMMETADQCPKIAKLLSVLLDGLEQLFTQRLTLAKKAEQFSGDPKTSARYLVALTRGIAVIERTYNEEQRLTEIYTTALANMPFKQ